VFCLFLSAVICIPSNAPSAFCRHLHSPPSVFCFLPPSPSCLFLPYSLSRLLISTDFYILPPYAFHRLVSCCCCRLFSVVFRLLPPLPLLPSALSCRLSVTVLRTFICEHEYMEE
jgi:hypothetical protein